MLLKILNCLIRIEVCAGGGEIITFARICTCCIHWRQLAAAPLSFHTFCLLINAQKMIFIHSATHRFIMLWQMLTFAVFGRGGLHSDARSRAAAGGRWWGRRTRCYSARLARVSRRSVCAWWKAVGDGVVRRASLLYAMICVIRPRKSM